MRSAKLRRFSVLSWRGSVFFPNRSEDIQVEHRLVTDHLPPMHDVWRNLQQASRTEDDALVADVETDVARDDINELLIGVLVGLRLVLRHELMQRHCRAGARKRLAHDAFADGLPRHVFPI